MNEAARRRPSGFEAELAGRQGRLDAFRYVQAAGHSVIGVQLHRCARGDAKHAPAELLAFGR